MHGLLANARIWIWPISMTTDFSASKAAGIKAVRDHSRSQLQTFFDELKNGTQNYRTLASLDSQVSQAYQGRCILELLQNAHDALQYASPDDPRLITFALATSPEPVLLVGNSGRPFRNEDFKGLCQLGQSPKDPNESVGNKGLGFRSVFEVSSRPEIWSSAPSSNAASFVFRFDPSISECVAAAARDLEISGLDARSPFDPESPLVDWSDKQLNRYRERLANLNIHGAGEASNSLSPYLFPVPIMEACPEVERLLREEHVTVVRLPLDGGRTGSSESAVHSIETQLKELDATSTIFLHHLEKLVVEVDGQQQILERIVDEEELIAGCRRTRRERLLVGSSGSETEENATYQFNVWRRDVGGDADLDQAKQIRVLVEHLPNRWPEVRKVELGVAVEDADSSGKGSFVIFLPTETKTGTGAHINAPFYGSLDRRHINFEDKYNNFLLENALDLCLDAVADLVSGGQPNDWQAKAVIDLLSSTTHADGLNQSITECLQARAMNRDCALDDLALILCDGGWHVPSEARLMPTIAEDCQVGRSYWREHAGFSVVSPVLDGRREAVKQLFFKLRCSAVPTDDEWVRTIERVADCVRRKEIDVSWDSFLNCVVDLLPERLRDEPRWGTDPLAGAAFIPDQDGRLIPSSGDIKMFFQPVRGVDDAADFATKVPDCLKAGVAFLHPSIQTQEGPRRKNTKVQKFLDRFVRGFVREEILQEVIIPALPELPVRHGSEKAVLCSELLSWTIQLLGENPRATLFNPLKQMPVACYGGWYAMCDAVFGPGWLNRLGNLVWSLVEELPESASSQLRETLLLPPDDQRWGGTVEHWNEIFAHAGTTDGLRLRNADKIRFEMDKYSYELPRDAPAGTPDGAWNDWRVASKNEVKPRFAGSFKYVLSGVYLLPELHQHEHFNSRGRKAFSQLLLDSLAHWPDGWQNATIKKLQGDPCSWKITGPLKHWLSTIPWLHDGTGVVRELPRRWFVPVTRIRGRKDRFQHLEPLSLDLAREVEAKPKLFDALKNLGLNIYPEEDDQIGPELLEALAVGWADGKVPLERFDEFLGQIRDAWRHFHFDPNRGLPEKFVVRTGLRKFSIRMRDELADIFLPDNRDQARSLKDNGKSLLEMRTVDAKRLAKALLAATNVRQASSLEVRCLVDGDRWNGAEMQIQRLDGSRYKWLPVPLLAVAAYGGSNPTGPETQRWCDAVERLRRARLLDCTEIVTQLVEGDDVLAESRPSALWLPDDVLAIRNDVNTSYKQLAPAAEMLLDRQDLLKDLRLVLGELENLDNPTPEQIEKALRNNDVETEELSVVRTNWYGNLSFLADRIRPVLALLGIPNDGFESAATDRESLTEWLDANVQRWPVSKMLEAARGSHDDYAMGLAAWHALGDIAALPKWNAALSELGQRYAAIENDLAIQQANSHLDEARPLLRAFARHIAVEVGKPELFRELEEINRNIQGCIEWRHQWWEVPFSAVMNAMCVGYSKIMEEEHHLAWLEGMDSMDDLRTVFRKKEIAIDPDPYEVARQNRSQLEDTLCDVHDLYRVWMAREDSEQITPELPQLPTELHPEAYLRQWSETEIIERSIHIIGDEAFTSACDGCFDLDQIRCRLRLEAKEVESCQRERQEWKREEERRNRTVNVAGMGFEQGSNNFRELWQHLENLPDPIGPQASNDILTDLAEITTASRFGKAGSSEKNADFQRQSPELVGKVGEMHAYRFLRKEFGTDVVTLDAWVSGNRLELFPLVEGEPNKTNDGLGCDFRFNHDGKQWHVEVKATAGQDTQFDLGISEINAATRMSSEVRGEIWRILRVRGTLTTQPEFDWLLNPFNELSKGFFRLHNGGMKVSYVRK